jgi:hypothetical protein
MGVEMLKNGTHTTSKEIATAENINASVRGLRLICLA